MAPPSFLHRFIIGKTLTRDFCNLSIRGTAISFAIGLTWREMLARGFPIQDGGWFMFVRRVNDMLMSLALDQSDS